MLVQKEEQCVCPDGRQLRPGFGLQLQRAALCCPVALRTKKRLDSGSVTVRQILYGAEHNLTAAADQGAVLLVA